VWYGAVVGKREKKKERRRKNERERRFGLVVKGLWRFGVLPERLRPEGRRTFKAYDGVNNIFNFLLRLHL
jgi:ribonuclease I